MPQLEQVDTFASQIFWLVVTFVPLFFVLWRVVLPRISATLENRQKRIENDIARADELSQEAETVMAAYEAELTKARSAAQEELHNAAEAAAAEADQRNAELTEKLSEDAAKARERIDAARTAAVGNISSIAEEIAGQAVARLIGEAPESGPVRSAVDAAVRERV